MSYLVLKHIHITCVVLSGLGFCLRGWWMLTESAMRQHRLTRIWPHFTLSPVLPPKSTPLLLPPLKLARIPLLTGRLKRTLPTLTDELGADHAPVGLLLDVLLPEEALLVTLPVALRLTRIN